MSSREKITLGYRMLIGMSCLVLAAAGIAEVLRNGLEGGQMVTAALSSAMCLFCIFRLLYIGKVNMTLELSIIAFLTAFVSNVMLVFLIFTATSLVQQLHKFIKEHRRDRVYFVYRASAPPVSFMLACFLISAIPFRDAFANANGIGVLKAVLILYGSLYINVFMDLLDIYIEKNDNMFKLMEIYLAAFKGGSILAGITAALVLVFPHTGNAGLAAIYITMVAALQFSYLYVEQQKMNENYNKVLNMVSKSMTVGNLYAIAENMLKELAQTFESTIFSLYVFDKTMEKQLPKMLIIYHMNEFQEFDYGNYSIDIEKNVEFIKKLGTKAGNIHVEENTQLAGLENSGKGFLSPKGMMATPIVGVDGVEGMLAMIAEHLYIDRKLKESVMSLAGRQLSTKLVDERMFNECNNNVNKDSLTGMMNRSVFESVIASCERDGREFIVALFDIDDFKGLNEAHGEEYGNHVMKRIAAIVLQYTRGSDYAFRFGMDQFCILFNHSDMDMAYEIAEKIRNTVEESTHSEEAKPGEVTISAGIAGFPRNGKTSLKVIFEADRAMRAERKQSGGNRVTKA